MNYNNKNEVLPPFSKSPSPFPYPSDTPHRIIRIADILVHDSDSDVTDFFDMDGSDQITTIQCSTPRRVVSRWFSALKQRGKGAKFVSRGSEKRDREIGRPQVRRSTNGLNGHDGSRSGRCGKEVKGDYSSFNLGVACGLLYVVAAGRNELTKMVEMRTQMEHILHDAKQELHTSNANANTNANANADVILNSKPLESNDNNLSSFTTDFQQGSSSAGSQFSLQSVANCGGECEAGMDQLEAELEAELERLQLHLDPESDSSISFSAQQQMLRGDGGEEESAIWGCSGVDPFELERKLNQVVEARQEERIRELEDALECAQHKLYHKEMELSWWKNAAATLMSGHDQHPT